MIINSLLAVLSVVGLLRSEWRPRLADLILIADAFIVWTLVVVSPLMKFGPKEVSGPQYSYDPPVTWVIFAMLASLVLILIGLYRYREVLAAYTVKNNWFWLLNSLVFIYLSIGAYSGNLYGWLV